MIFGTIFSYLCCLQLFLTFSINNSLALSPSLKVSMSMDVSAGEIYGASGKLSKAITPSSWGTFIC